MSFADFGLDARLLRTLSAEGYETPTPIQSLAIPHVLAGRDVLGCAQTGTGKTAAFALPIVQRLLTRPVGGRGPFPVRTVVLAPTRELACQIGDNFLKYAQRLPLRQALIFGGVSHVPQIRALQRGIDIVIATPGRLCDLMDQGFVDFSRVETVVLDEADRMLDMGFLPDLKKILGSLPQKRQSLLFSATMPPAIQQLADSMLHEPAKVTIAPEVHDSSLIEQSLCFVPQPRKSDVLIHLLQKHAVSRAVVFARTKHGADRIATNLERAGFYAESLHGDKTQAARQRILWNFRSSKPPILVATDLAARGIDVDGVSHVFNFDLPHEPETYVHRIGRTGRAGATGMAISFCDGIERPLLRAIERTLGQVIPVEPDYPMEALPRSFNGDRAPGRSRGRGQVGGRMSGPRQDGRPGERPSRPPRSGGSNHPAARRIEETRTRGERSADGAASGAPRAEAGSRNVGGRPPEGSRRGPEGRSRPAARRAPAEGTQGGPAMVVGAPRRKRVGPPRNRPEASQ